LKCRLPITRSPVSAARPNHYLLFPTWPTVYVLAILLDCRLWRWRRCRWFTVADTSRCAVSTLSAACFMFITATTTSVWSPLATRCLAAPSLRCVSIATCLCSALVLISSSSSLMPGLSLCLSVCHALPARYYRSIIIITMRAIYCHVLLLLAAGQSVVRSVVDDINSDTEICWDALSIPTITVQSCHVMWETSRRLRDV